MLIEGYELFIFLVLIIVSNEGLDGAEGHVFERYFLYVTKNELLDKFIYCIRITLHQSGISCEEQHALVTRLSIQHIFFQTCPVGFLHTLIDTALLARSEKRKLNWVTTYIHPLRTPSQVEGKFVLDTRNALRNLINNARLEDKLLLGLDSDALE